MSSSKFPFRWRLPRADDATLTPAVLAGVLVAMLVLQGLWTEPEPLADAPVAMRHHVKPPLPAMDRVTVDPTIAANAIFAPRGRTRPGSPASNAASSPLEGNLVTGSMSVGARSAVIVKRPDGRVVSVPVGGRIAGWMLRSIGQGAAVFVRNGRRLVVPFVSGAPGAAPGEGGEPS